jgi:hypothetical protein
MKFHNLYIRGAGLVLFWGLILGQSVQAMTFTLTPSSVSNTYPGYITLQVNSVPSGSTVIVQKYFDANTNGIVDAGDLLVQEGKLVDGQAGVVSGGVTNFNVPYDLDGASNGQITANIFLKDGDFIQGTIGQYLFVLSSTNGSFASVTNVFTVTNLPYPQQLTGTVTNDSGTAVPNAIVVMFPPPRPGHDHGPGDPVASGVANNSGVYSMKLPAGSYVPLAFQSNYVASYSTSPLLTLGSGQTLNTNLAITSATTSVSGSLVDSSSGKPLQGVFMPASSQAGIIAVGFTDTNGNFNIPVISNQTWSLGGDSGGLIIHSYLGYENDPTNVNSGASGVTIMYPKSSALVYGHVMDTQGNPVAGVPVEAFTTGQNNNYQQDGYTDTNGNYVVPVVGGLGNNDQWQVNVDKQPTNYVFTMATSQQNGGTNINSGQAVQQNFLAMKTTQIITGHVQDNNSNAIVGVGVYATTTVGANTFETATEDTDNNGNYTLYVANTNTWNVTVLGCCGDDSLSQLGSYQVPNRVSVGITNNNGVANFTVQQCTSVQILDTNLPSGQVGSFYDYFLNGSTCNGNQIWTVIDQADFPTSLTLGANGEIYGTPDTATTYNFTVNLSDGSGNSTNRAVSLTINPGVTQLQIMTFSLPAATNGTFYNIPLQATGGLGAYTWGLAQGSANLPANLSLSPGGVISGMPTTAATNYNFIVQVTDTNSDFAFQQLSLNIVGAPPGVTLSMVPAGAGTLKFTFTSVAGVNYSLQTSPDLKAWSTILSFTGGGGLETISAPTTGSAETFYRVKAGP